MKHVASAVVWAASVVLAVGTICQAEETGAMRRPANADEDQTKVIAVVLEREVTAADKGDLSGIILGDLLDRYALDANLDATDEELDAFADEMLAKREQHLAADRKKRTALLQELRSDKLSDADREKKQDELSDLDKLIEFETKRSTSPRASYRAIGMMFVTRWKVNKALYEKFGGRVIAQQVGPEPLDAYRKFLEAEQKKGSFKIVDKQCEPLFWEYFTNEKKHIFYSDEKGEKFIKTPWWLLDESGEEAK